MSYSQVIVRFYSVKIKERENLIYYILGYSLSSFLIELRTVFKIFLKFSIYVWYFNKNRL